MPTPTTLPTKLIRTFILLVLACCVLAGSLPLAAVAQAQSAGVIVNEARVWFEKSSSGHKVRGTGFTPDSTVRLRLERDGRTVTVDGTTFQKFQKADASGTINATAFRLDAHEVKPGDIVVLAEQSPGDIFNEPGWIDVRAHAIFDEPDYQGPRVTLSPIPDGRLRIVANGFEGNGTIRARIERDGRTLQQGGVTFQKFSTIQDGTGIAASAFSFHPTTDLQPGDVIVVAQQMAGGWDERQATYTFVGIDEAGRALEPSTWLERSGGSYKVRGAGFSPNTTVRLRIIRNGKHVTTAGGTTFQIFQPTDASGGINASAFRLDGTQVRLGDHIVLEEQNSADTAGEPGWIDDMATVVFNEQPVGARAVIRSAGGGQHRVIVEGFLPNTTVRLRVYRNGVALRNADVEACGDTVTFQRFARTDASGRISSSEFELSQHALSAGDEIRLAERNEADTIGEPGWLERKVEARFDGPVPAITGGQLCIVQGAAVPNAADEVAEPEDPIARPAPTVVLYEHHDFGGQSYKLEFDAELQDEDGQVWDLQSGNDKTSSIKLVGGTPGVHALAVCKHHTGDSGDQVCAIIEPVAGTNVVEVDQQELRDKGLHDNISMVVWIHNGIPNVGARSVDVRVPTDTGASFTVGIRNFDVNALPAAALPAAAIPSNALPAAALPAAAIPSNLTLMDFLVVEALPAAARPFDAIPSNLVLTDFLTVDALPGGPVQNDPNG